MEKALEGLAAEIKQTVRSVLGDKPSQIFLGRVDRTIDDAATNKESLGQACVKVENMVKLFIGVEEANVLGKRFKEICNKAA